jgi:hypothetical protein
MVPEPGEAPSGLRIEDLACLQVNRDSFSRPEQVKFGQGREVLLDIAPPGRVLSRVVDRKDHRQRLGQPGVQVRPLDAENDRQPISGSLAPLGRFDLKEDLPSLLFPFLIVGEEDQVDAVIVDDPFQGEPAQQELPFDVVDTQIADDVLARASLLRKGSALSRHPGPSLLPAPAAHGSPRNGTER